MKQMFNFSKIKVWNLLAKLTKLSVAGAIVFNEPPKCTGILYQPKRPESMRVEK